MKYYELTNHLGNILSVVSDRKKPFAKTTNQNVVDFYVADIKSVRDYYPFGMEMPGREFTSSSYRYGFNGKELDKEITSTTTYDYGFRIYSPGLGRFLSVDPLTISFPYFSPYHYAGGNPVAATDLDGKECDWLTWKVVFWLSKAKFQGTNAGNNFAKNLNTIATTDKMGQFKGSDPSSIQQQVEDKKIKTFQATNKATKSIIDITKYSAIGVATPFVITAAAPVLPELFTVAGSSELTLSGYLAQKTILATADAGAQKLVTGKIDLADVLADYLPTNNVFQKALVNAFQSSVDYTSNKGFQTIFGSGKNEKSLTDAISEYIVSGTIDKVFGNFNTQLEKGFIKKGLKGESLTNAMGSVLKSEYKFLETTLKTSLSEKAKLTLDEKNIIKK